MKKVQISNVNDMREKVQNGIAQMDDLVSLTCGPNGLSIMIERGAGEPLIVDDGRRVAENIKLDDPIEQLAVRTCFSVTKKTDEKAGDGTTRAMIMTRGIVDSVFNDRLKIVALGRALGSNVNDIDHDLKESCKNVVAQLEKMAKPIKTEKELIDVATFIAADEHIGEVIGKMYHELGKDGHITLEFNLLSDEIETEITKGMRLTAGMVKPWMIVDKLRGRTIVDNIDVLLVNRKDLSAGQLQNVVTELQTKGKTRLLIIARRFTEELIAVIRETANAGHFAVFCVQFPMGTAEHYEDVAIFTGARAFQESDSLDDITANDLGYLGRFDASEEETILMEGGGDKKKIQQRIKEVEKEMQSQKVHQFKQLRQERISALFGGVGVIRIGAPTDEERNWLKHKIEDAKIATKVAFREGVVPGGGMALKTIAESLPDTDILKKALMRPHDILKRNANGPFTVPKGVVDPVGVEKAALTAAVSAASKLIRIGGGVAFARKPTLDEAMSAFTKNSNSDVMDDDDETE